MCVTSEPVRSATAKARTARARRTRCCAAAPPRSQMRLIWQCNGRSAGPTVLSGQAVKSRCRGGGFWSPRSVTAMDRCPPSAWNGSWNDAPDNLSAVGAVSAITRAIRAASALSARGRTTCKRQVTSSTAIQVGHNHALIALLTVAARDKRAHCNWLEQLQITDSLLTCSGLVCVLVGYIFASSAPGNLRLRQVNGAGPALRQVLAHCPRRQLVQRVPRRSTRPARDVRKQAGDAGHLGHLGLARASQTQGQ
jgi:hypothetical protein